MYVTMSISTGLYPKLDLWKANKLQYISLHYTVNFKFVMDIDHKRTYKFCMKYCLYIITNLAMVWNLEVVSDKFKWAKPILKSEVSP